MEFRVLDLYDIMCTKKKWNTSLPLASVNEFSGVAPQTQETISLKDYLVDMGELSYDFDEAGKENGENQLYYISSDISFKFSGIENNQKLKTFFGFFEDTDYTKWKVSIEKENVKIWEGFIHHESIEITFSPELDSEIISLTALSLEKEFKEFYSQRDLRDSNNIFSLVGGVNAATKRIKGLDGINFTNHEQDYHRLATPLSNVLHNLFPGINFTLTETNIRDWHIINNPVLYPKTQSYGTTDNFVFVKSSYERIKTHGENCYDFLRRICNSMGWVFYYQNGSFKIKNRGTDLPTITNLDVNKILEYTVTKYKETSTFPHLLLLDGTIDGGDGTGGNIGGTTEDEQPYQMRGARFQLISDIANPTKISKGVWWKAIDTGGHSGFDFFYLDINDKFIRYFGDDDSVFRCGIHKRSTFGVGLFGWTLEKTSAGKSDMLRIDCGDTDTEMWLYDVVTGWNAPHSSNASLPAPENQWTHNRVRFKGNYGNCMVQLSHSLGFLRYGISSTYQDYVKTPTFFNNWIKFFESKQTRKVTVKYDEIIDNPIQVFKFLNDSNNHFTGTWIINSMKINFQDETTVLELQQKFDRTIDPNVEDIISIDIATVADSVNGNDEVPDKHLFD